MQKHSPQQQRLPKKLSEYLAEAESEAEREYPSVVADLGPAIDVLLKRKFSWSEIASWFAQRGAVYSPGSLAHGWRKWSGRNQTKPVVEQPSFLEGKTLGESK